MWLLSLACAVPAPKPDTGDPAPSASTASTGSTGETAHTADTGPATVLLRHWVWEVDRACWALKETERPEQYWAAFLLADCQGQSDDTFTTYADADGFCGRWERPFGWDYAFGRDCSVQDPWLLDCSAVPGCCEREVPGIGCVPPYYEPY